MPIALAHLDLEVENIAAGRPVGVLTMRPAAARLGGVRPIVHQARWPAAE